MLKRTGKTYTARQINLNEWAAVHGCLTIHDELDG